MQIDGYRPHGKRHETDELHMFLAEVVVQFLSEASAPGSRSRPHARKVGATLESIRRNGLQGLNNNTLFKAEGKYPSGQPGMADMVVYAVKSDQVRVYGGIVRIKGQSAFLCPQGVIKKDQKADRVLLEKVAKVLGIYHER